MLIKEHALHHWIKHFYGYGSWQAPFWFVSHEESGGEVPEEVAEKLDYFEKTHPFIKPPALCHIRDLYQQVTFRTDGPKADFFKTRYDYRFGPQATLHGVWKNLAAFIFGYENKPLPDLLEYQKNSFASPSTQREALIPLYPLPGPHSHAWYYNWLDLPSFPFLKSRALYQQHAYSGRIDTILRNISIHHPEVVLMYGMENINALKKSIQDFFPEAKFKMVKGVKQQTPQHHRTDLPKTTLLITTQIPALRHNRVETGFDWYTFGRQVKLKS